MVLAVRNTVKGDAVAATIPGSTEVKALDLGSLASIHAFAQAWTGDVDILINNAGVMATPLTRTPDGFELQIGTNFLGHFALTNLLLPHITDRIVNVSSVLNSLGHIDAADLNWSERKYKPWRAYGQSKLASLLITGQLQRRLQEQGSAVRAVTAHPGVARTHLGGHLEGGLQTALFRIGVLVNGTTVEVGARPILFAATQDVAGDSYFGPAKGGSRTPTPVKRSRRERDQIVAGQLWDAAATLTHTQMNAESGR